MTATDRDRKLDEVERLLNDPDRRMDADRVWSLLAEIAQAHGAQAPELQAAAT